MPNRLAEILENKRHEIAGLDEGELRQVAEKTPPGRDFLAALRRGPGDPVRLIAELKKASPSRGLLSESIDLLAVARTYATRGASAISVLTDPKYFQGTIETLAALRFRENSPVPLLRKDFILSPAQVYQSHASGADALLLIAAALTDDKVLSELHALILEMGMMPLVEVHTIQEVERVLLLDKLACVGINNRDLGTFQVSLKTTWNLRPYIPAGITVVAESGIFTAADVSYVGAAGVDAVLVGEALITAQDIGTKVVELSTVRPQL